jgi:TatA/E family protein of Tat protein translocase
MSLGSPEILVVVVLVLLLFGPDRLPGLMKSVGRGIREIKRVTSDFQNHFDFEDDTPPRSASRPAPQNPADDLETIPPPQPQVSLDQAHHNPSQENEKEREA